MYTGGMPERGTHPKRRDIAAVDRAVRHVREDESAVTIDLAGLSVMIAFAEKLNAIERDYHAGRIETAAEYHRRLVEARTWMEMHK